MKLKILNLTGHALKDSRGEYEYNLCKHLEAEGIEVFDLALYGNNSHYCKNVKMAKKPLWILPKKIGNFFSQDIIKEINKNYDVIHVHGPYWSPIPMQALIIKKILRKKTPIIMTTHAYFPEKQIMMGPALKEAFFHGKIFSIFNAIKCLPYRQVDKIICHSKEEKEFIINKFKIKNSKITVVPNGVDIKRFEQEKKDFIKKELIKNKFTVLYVGQLIKIKGVDYLIDAVLELIKNSLNIILLIATYTHNSEIEKRIKDNKLEKNIIILKDLKEVDLITAYQNCDLFVLPSFTESFSIVLLEAMAAKKPVIATKIQGITSWVKDEYNGLLVNPGESKEIENAIKRIREDKKLAKNISLNGYEIVKEKYSWESIIKIIINEYKELIKENIRKQ